MHVGSIAANNKAQGKQCNLQDDSVEVNLW